MDARKPATAPGRGQQDIERFRGGDPDVGRAARHDLALVCRGVARADGDPDFRRGQPFVGRELRDFLKRDREIAVHIVRQRLQRGDVQDLGAVGELAAETSAQQTIEADQEGGERLARAGRRGNQRGAARGNRGPPFGLRRRRPGEPPLEPLLHDRMKELPHPLTIPESQCLPGGARRRGCPGVPSRPRGVEAGSLEPEARMACRTDIDPRYLPEVLECGGSTPLSGSDDPLAVLCNL